MYNQKQKQEKIRYMYENSVHTIYCIQFQVMYCTKVELLFLHYTSSTTFFVVDVANPEWNFIWVTEIYITIYDIFKKTVI